MKDREKYELSVISPLYNEEDSILPFYSQLKRILIELKIKYEIILINDGSTDDTPNLIKELESTKKSRVKAIQLETNKGQLTAIYEGISKSNGEYILIIDSDLQQDPKILTEIWNERNSYDVIQMVQEKRKEKIMKRVMSKTFYKTISWISGFDFVANVGEFRLISGKVRNGILDELIPGEDIRFYLQLRKYKTKYVNYMPQKRPYGNTKYGIQKMIYLAVKSIVGATRRPLIQIGFFGIVFCSLLSAYSVYALLQQFQNESIPGWTSVILLLTFGFVFILLTLIIIGVYIAELIRITRHLLTRERSYDSR